MKRIYVPPGLMALAAPLRGEGYEVVESTGVVTAEEFAHLAPGSPITVTSLYAPSPRWREAQWKRERRGRRG